MTFVNRFSNVTPSFLVDLNEKLTSAAQSIIKDIYTTYNDEQMNLATDLAAPQAAASSYLSGTLQRPGTLGSGAPPSVASYAERFAKFPLDGASGARSGSVINEVDGIEFLLQSYCPTFSSQFLRFDS